MTRVLLAASYPDDGARGRDVRPFAIEDIDLAASAVIEATLMRGWTLTFGGHPTISPLVLSVANILGKGHLVEIFQSEFFRPSVTKEVEDLVKSENATVRWTSASRRKKDRAGSLAIMRSEMIARRVDAAFYVGGMSGIRDEFDQVLKAHPTAHVFLFTRPGGMAARLAQERGDEPTAALEDDKDTRVQQLSPHVYALHDRGYASLALQALDLVAARPK